MPWASLALQPASTYVVVLYGPNGTGKSASSPPARVMDFSATSSSERAGGSEEQQRKPRSRWRFVRRNPRITKQFGSKESTPTPNRIRQLKMEY